MKSNLKGIDDDNGGGWLVGWLWWWLLAAVVVVMMMMIIILIIIMKNGIGSVNMADFLQILLMHIKFICSKMMLFIKYG